MIKSKNLKNDSRFSSEEQANGRKGSKKKPILYTIPEEDSFMPIDEDSEEIKYQTKKNVS